MSTVIIGGGIIGVATAYYLCESATVDPSSIHIVERSPIPFRSATGFSGGFVAPDWFSSEVIPLGRLSFDLHQKLARDCNGSTRWGYNKTSGLSLTEELVKNGTAPRGDEWILTGASRSQAARSKGGDQGALFAPPWMRSRDVTIESLGDAGTCAQVDPCALGQFLLQHCQTKGVHVHLSKVAKKINCSEGEVNSLQIEDPDSGAVSTVPCQRLVLTAGAWTGRVFETLFPDAEIKLPIGSVAGYSLTLRSPSWTNNRLSDQWHAIFCSATGDGRANDFSAELFARRGGSGDAELFVGGLNDSKLPLPEYATGSPPDRKYIDILMKKAREMLSIERQQLRSETNDRTAEVSGKLDIIDTADTSLKNGDLEIIRTGLCWRPVTDRSQAIVDKVPGDKLGKKLKFKGAGGVWIAAGHGPWGISLSLGTGKVMSEMIEGLTTSCDISGLALLDTQSRAKL